MKNPTLSSFACFCLLSMFMMLYSCQKEESSNEPQTLQLKSNSNASDKKQKIDVCHKNHIINISSNAVPAHQNHGDAVDMDGDGYFDMDNSCSETDCDDNNPEINPGSEENCDHGDMSTAELLVGTWTSGEVNITASVDGQSVIDYLVNVVELSQAEAERLFGLLEDELTAEVTGSLTLRSDMTYVSNFNMGSDSGTWSLSSDEQTLTLFEGPVDVIIITINAISEDIWDATTGGLLMLDLDDDPSTADVEVMAAANVILTKV